MKSRTTRTIRSLAVAVAATGALALAGCSAIEQDDTTRDEEGAILEGGEVGAFSIKVGDCIGAEVGTSVETVEGVPCGEPHQYEVYHAFDIPTGDGTFPGETEVDEAANQGCLEAFADFVGLAYEQSIYSVLPLTPTSETWTDLDDREVLCLIGNGDGTPLTGSARDTAI